MSVFSIIKRVRQAKEQTDKPSNKQSGKQREERPTTKYFHVPTHAAADALLGAPAGWMPDDAERIRESNRKRTAMITARATRLQHRDSTTMLSPLHINVHADSNGYGSGNGCGSGSGGSNSSTSSNRGSHWAQPSSSQSKTRCSPELTSPAMYAPPNFNSLDAELYRARVSTLDGRGGPHAPRRAPSALIPPPSSSSSSSPRSSPSSSPSTSPSTCSIPSFGPSGNSKSKDDDCDYFRDISGAYVPYSPEALEMRVLSSNTANARNADNYGSNSYIRMVPSRQDIPLARIQQRRRNPYSHPVRIEEPCTSFLQTPSRPAFSRSTSERTLVPATIVSPKLFLTCTTRTQPDSKTAVPEKASPVACDDTQQHAEATIETGAAIEHAASPSKQVQWPLYTRTHPEAVAF